MEWHSGDRVERRSGILEIEWIGGVVEWWSGILEIEWSGGVAY